jgi:hypothetical protein
MTPGVPDLFRDREILRGWDGKIKGQNAENGNYFCKVSGETFTELLSMLITHLYNKISPKLE